MLVHFARIHHIASCIGRQRSFGHRVHTICRPYEKTGRPVRRRLRIPCGLLKQLFCFSLPFSSPIVPFSTTTKRVPVPKSRRPSLPPHQLARAIISFPLSFSSPSDRKSTRFRVIEERQRAIGRGAATRRLLVHDPLQSLLQTLSIRGSYPIDFVTNPLIDISLMAFISTPNIGPLDLSSSENNWKN